MCPSSGFFGKAMAWWAATSVARTSSPTPPSRLTVPVKQSSTTSSPMPIASKIWAPV